MNTLLTWLALAALTTWVARINARARLRDDVLGA